MLGMGDGWLPKGWGAREAMQLPFILGSPASMSKVWPVTTRRRGQAVWRRLVSPVAKGSSTAPRARPRVLGLAVSRDARGCWEPRAR